MVSYVLSPPAASLVSERLKEINIENFGSLYYPAIMWSLGGSPSPSESVGKPIPPHYSIVYIKKGDISRMIALESGEFGFIGFSPSQEDKNSDRNLIDYIDEDIIVTSS
jgi:hypothetical protein